MTKPSTARMSRHDLVAALNRAMRDASGQGVLYSQTVAERLGINSTDLECLDSVVLRGPLTAGELVIVPLFQPMERAVLSALSDYSDKELALLLDFFARARDAAADAMTALRTQAKPARKPRRGSRRISAADRSE